MLTQIEPLEVFGQSVLTVCVCTSILESSTDKFSAMVRIGSVIDVSQIQHSVNTMVWKESLQQTDEMLEYWKSLRTITTTYQDIKILTMHVLTYIVFGTSYSFLDAVDSKESTASIPYRNAIVTLIENIFLVLAVRQWILRLPIAPQAWRKVGYAIADIKQYIRVSVEREKSLFQSGLPTQVSLLSSLALSSLRQLPLAKVESRADSRLEPLQGVSESDILGNMFTITFAGHETTGNTVSYCIFYLAAFPQWQKWIVEEIKEVFADQPSCNWEYEKSYSRLKRCQAVLVRICPNLTVFG